MALAYIVKSLPVGDTRMPRPHAVSSCYSCGQAVAIPLGSQGNNPERVGKKIRKMGWEFDPWHTNRSRCSNCLNKIKIAKQKEDQMSKQQSPMTVPMTSNVTALPPDKTALTPSERKLVRDMLEAYFENGAYSNGYSDHRVADELKLPRAPVTELRDVAFGPIKNVPEFDAIEADLKKLRTQDEQWYKQIQGLEQRIRQAKQMLGLES